MKGLEDSQSSCSTAKNTGHKRFVFQIIMHQSIPAVPIPPRTNPRALAFKKKMANSRGWGQVSPSNAPGWEQNRRQMPHPRDHLESDTSQDFNNKS